MKNKKCWCCKATFIFVAMLLVLMVVFVGIPKLKSYGKDEYTFIINSKSCEYKDSGYVWNTRLHEEINITVNKSEIPILNREIIEYRFSEKAKKEYNFTKEYNYCYDITMNPNVVYEDNNIVVYSIRMIYADRCYKDAVVCEFNRVDRIEVEAQYCIYSQNSDGKIEFCEHFGINENELSIEWLENNANCIENEGDCYLYYDSSNDLSTPKNIRGESGCIQKECSKYEFGNYTVSVIK